MPVDFEAYCRSLAAIALDAKTEHTDRAALQTLLQALVDDAEPGALVVHEPRRDKGGGGSPDFKIVRQGRIAGYVEVKPIDENLSKVLKSDQIKKYKTLSGNIVLTDYLEFCWIKAGGEVIRQRLANSDDLTAKKLRLRPEAVEAVRLLMRGFASATPERISRARDLALALAERARMLRDFLTIELIRQAKDHTEGRLHALFQVFREQIFHELETAAFADAFAQMLAYGLFLARLNAGEHDNVTLSNVRKFIPGSFTLIRELVRFLEEMNEPEYRDIRWVVDEILSIVNGLDLAAIHNDLSFLARKAISRKVRAEDEEEHRLFERDPFIYFYEDFLKAYDPAMRKSRGVYYTPPPVVNFIVRAVDDILKSSFGIKDGLADHNKVTVLDFACGTGTFLLEVFQRVFETIGGADSGRADLIVREHLTRNMFGFEYLIAPYTIAHLKLSQYLRDQGHPLKGDERLQVFLTNTLEPVEPQPNFNFPAISAEVAAAQKIKDRQILVITGNPPYSGHSKNKGAWISAQIDAYKYTVERRPDVASVDGFGPEERVSLGERNPKWLNDDYVKFIRFAQWKMDDVNEGVVGVITNHSWLDNPTFRGMRQSLMRSFDQIYVLDLHGNAKKKETTPDGGKDENVFDIEQGVAISLFVKKPGLEKGVWRGDIWGKRLEKYEALADGIVGAACSQQLHPAGPSYLLSAEDPDERRHYNSWPSVRDIFALSGTGIITKRDKLTIHFTESEIWEVVKKFVSTELGNLHRTFNLVDDVRDWKAGWAKRDLLESGPSKQLIKKILYRPFDERFTYYTGNSRGFIGWPVPNIMKHMVGKNISLVTARTNKSPSPDHFLATALPAETKAGESTTQSYNFPLFVLVDGTMRENLSPEFRAEIDEKYEHHWSAEEIFGYVYAVLFSPSHRARYAYFLRGEFPRIPLVGTTVEFENLSSLGWTLAQAHLLRELPRRGLAAYPAKGDHTVEAVRYSPDEQAIWINKSQSFAPVPQTVWDFHIGGYQVLDKYLKSRKGRILTLDEINHVGAVADSLAFTIDQMALIDVAYRKAFPDSSKNSVSRANSRQGIITARK